MNDLAQFPTVYDGERAVTSLGHEQVQRAVDAGVLWLCDGQGKKCPGPPHETHENGVRVADAHFAKGKTWDDFEAAAHE